MLSERWLRGRPDDVRAALARRHAGAEALAAYEQWRSLDETRRAAATRYDTLAAEVKRLLAAGRAASDQRDALQAEQREMRLARDELAARQRAL
ncbi:MAG: hypothetical protein KGO05_05310, partial [Chloroflexota bacterium]|nr:hypothetical protein [Chloroflexota bacterium]